MLETKNSNPFLNKDLPVGQIETTISTPSAKGKRKTYKERDMHSLNDRRPTETPIKTEEQEWRDGHAVQMAKFEWYFHGGDDSVLVPKPEEDPKNTKIFGVFDGVGGEEGGRIASQATVEFIREKTKSWNNKSAEEIQKEMQPLLSDAHGYILDHWKELAIKDGVHKDGLGDYAQMATTASIVQLCKDQEGNDRAVIGQVGDSSVFLLKADGEIKTVTDDTSSFLGYAGIAFKRLPVTYNISLKPGDEILIVSDGVTKGLKLEEINTLVRLARSQGKNPTELLVSQNVHRTVLGMRRGIYQGVDDSSAILIQANKTSNKAQNKESQAVYREKVAKYLRMPRANTWHVQQIGGILKQDWQRAFMFLETVKPLSESLYPELNEVAEAALIDPIAAYIILRGRAQELHERTLTKPDKGRVRVYSDLLQKIVNIFQ